VEVDPVEVENIEPELNSSTVGYLFLSLKNNSRAVCTCFMSPALLASRDLARAFWRAITEIFARIPIMAITTKSSMRVKARLFFIIIVNDLGADIIAYIAINKKHLAREMFFDICKTE